MPLQVLHPLYHFFSGCLARRLTLFCFCFLQKGILLEGSVLNLQWAGPSYSTVKEFSMGPNSSHNLVHHVADSIIKYGTEHACKLQLVL
jgi:hypothetical protein